MFRVDMLLAIIIFLLFSQIHHLCLLSYQVCNFVDHIIVFISILVAAVVEYMYMYRFGLHNAIYMYIFYSFHRYV